MGFWESAAVFGVAPLAGLLCGGLLFLPANRALWTRGHITGALRRHWKPLAIGFTVIALDVLETRLDRPWTKALGWDFTPAFSALDGDLVATVQQHLPQVAQLVLQVVYVVAFPFLLYFTPFLYAWADRGVALRRAVWAIGLCYVVALPFYLLLPVNEVWFVRQAPGPSHVDNLVTFMPIVGRHLYDFDGVNNNFPSLHTALSCSLAAVAWQCGPRRFSVFATVLAALTVVSTVALGIHWTADVAAGLALAGGVAWAVRRLVPDVSPQPMDPRPLGSAAPLPPLAAAPPLVVTIARSSGPAELDE